VIQIGLGFSSCAAPLSTPDVRISGARSSEGKCHGPNSCNGCKVVDRAVAKMLMMWLSIQTNLGELWRVSENSGQSEPGPIRTLASPCSCGAPLRVNSPCIWHWGVLMHSDIGAGPGQRLEGPAEQLRAYERCLGVFWGFPGCRLAGSRISAVSGFTRW